MKEKEIKAGMTYKNRGAGTTFRKVLSIGRHIPPPAGSNKKDEPVVEFLQNGSKVTLYLSSFAKWCGGVVSDIEARGTSEGKPDSPAECNTPTSHLIMHYLRAVGDKNRESQKFFKERLIGRKVFARATWSNGVRTDASGSIVSIEGEVATLKTSLGKATADLVDCVGVD